MTIPILINTARWTERAACRGLWELFDFDANRGHRARNYREAIAICREQCPVMAECREYAKTAGHIDGVWGGELVKVQGGHHRGAIDHGTRRGYDQHRRKRVPPCKECRDAVNARQREYKARIAAEADGGGGR